MRLARLHIEGFGIFHDREMRFEPGLNVVCGRNEAGKSTLLAFVQHVLFKGGIHSVELNLEPSEGASQFAETVYGPATEVVPEYVDRLLSGR